MTIMISSDIKCTHRPIAAPSIEAWQFTGQPKSEWPDWVMSKMQAVYGTASDKWPRPHLNHWALRDPEDGYFWRWMRPEMFAERYEELTPLRRAE